MACVHRFALASIGGLRAKICRMDQRGVSSLAGCVAVSALARSLERH
jgi:hypothetical protein